MLETRINRIYRIKRTHERLALTLFHSRIQSKETRWQTSNVTSSRYTTFKTQMAQLSATNATRSVLLVDFSRRDVRSDVGETRYAIGSRRNFNFSILLTIRDIPTHCCNCTAAFYLTIDRQYLFIDSKQYVYGFYKPNFLFVQTIHRITTRGFFLNVTD